MQAGFGSFRSMISAVAVGEVVQLWSTFGVNLYGAHGLPPMSSTLPSSYITDDPQLRVSKLLLPTKLQAPVPVASRYRVVWLGPAQNTLPLGATCIKG